MLRLGHVAVKAPSQRELSAKLTEGVSSYLQSKYFIRRMLLSSTIGGFHILTKSKYFIASVVSFADTYSLIFSLFSLN